MSQRLEPRRPGIHRRRWITVLVTLALVVGACSSSDDDSGGSTALRGPSVAEGEPFRLSVIVPDLAPLAEIGLAPDVGDIEQNFQVFVDEVNDADGAAGHELDLDLQVFPANATATEQQAQCVGATQDHDAFAVILLGGVFDETILCVTELHERIALVLAGTFPASTFERSNDRLFTNSVAGPRLMRAMVEALDEQGELEGRTLGLVRADWARDAEMADELRAALDDHGYELAEDVALPCEIGCEQNDIGVQRLTAADVDAVFSFLAAVAYPTFVGEAANQGYDPQWFSSDLENQVQATTARFFEAAADAYDGAIGTTSTGLDDPGAEDSRAECNERFTARTGVEYEPDSDAWRSVASACESIGRITRVIEQIAEDGLPLDQGTFIEAMENERVVLGASQGDFAPDKHDAYDVFELKRFSAACVCWESIEGTRWTDAGRED